MANVTDLIAYYVNLLIIQYNNLPKAQGHIGVLVTAVEQNGIAIDVENAYDIETAVGKQLDVIGKYVGVNRFFTELDLNNFFSLIEYSEISPVPDSPPRWGFTTQADFSDFDYNGTLIYDEIVTVTNGLSDENFRTLIKLKIKLNNMNYSPASIDDALWPIFGAAIRRESSGNMHMQYFINAPLTTLIQAVIAKDLLPHPMGVGVEIITDVTGDMFSFADYSGYESPFGYGFSTYSNYATLAGEVLTYSQIAEG